MNMGGTPPTAEQLTHMIVRDCIDANVQLGKLEEEKRALIANGHPEIIVMDDEKVDPNP